MALARLGKIVETVIACVLRQCRAKVGLPCSEPVSPAHPPGVPLSFPIQRNAAVVARQADSTDATVYRHPHGTGQIIAGQPRTSMHTQMVVQPLLPTPLQMARPHLPQLIAPDTRCEFEPFASWAQGKRCGLARHEEGSHLAIGLAQSDLKVIVQAAGIEVVDFEGAGGYCRFVHQHTALADAQ
ncbi:Uncharacterised protein [Pseudomonas putida]|nr:Uncharacterised protein [Pseudomonas putida]